MSDQTASFGNLFTRDDTPPRPASAFWNLFTHPDAPSASAPAPASPQAVPAALVFNEEHIFWALRNLPVGEAVKHLAIFGTTSAGKTTLIQLYLQSLARRFRRDWHRPEQLIIFDGKCDAVPLLSALGLHPEDENVYILNPYDERGVAWDLADGAQGPLLARHLAALLVPDERMSTAPYFPDSARDLLYAVILALNSVAGSHWQFRDLICALDSKERIRAITDRHPRAKVIASRIMDDEKHAFGVLSSLGTKMVRFEPVAALWHSSRNPRRFRIAEFLKRPGVLVISNDPVLRDSLWPINALLLKALTQEILRRPGCRHPRHWFVLDEFPAMEKVDSIHDLRRRGRSKGASVLLGMQGIEALNEVYGENAAADMLSQCAYKTFLRAGGPKTAEWAERFFGKVRKTEPVWSESWSHDGHFSSVQYNVIERSLFLASVFANLPLPQSGGPFIAISDVPCLGCSLTQLLALCDALRADAAALLTNDTGRKAALHANLVPVARRFYDSTLPALPAEPEITARLEAVRRIALQVQGNLGKAYEPPADLSETAQKTAAWCLSTESQMKQARAALDALATDAQVKFTRATLTSDSPTLGDAIAQLSRLEASSTLQIAGQILAGARTHAAVTVAQAEARKQEDNAQRQAETLRRQSEDAQQVLERERRELEARRKLEEAEHKARLDREAAEARKVELKKKASNPALLAKLAPFITPGYVGIYKPTYEKRPFSHSEMQSLGALGPSVEGLDRLVAVGLAPNAKVRPHWKIHPKRYRQQPNEYEMVKETQQLLIELGPVPVEMGKLDP